MNRRRILAASVGMILAACARQPAEGDELGALGQGLDDVTLTSASGERVRWSALKGRPRALFFGFTHCPVVCPVTVWELNDALERIGEPASNVVIQFVSVDPERDTPERLNSYFSSFGERVTSYTGDAESIDRLTHGFEVIVNRTALEGDDYTIDHTTTVFLIDGGGQVVDVIAYGSPPEVIEQRLRMLAGSRA